MPGSDFSLWRGAVRLGRGLLSQSMQIFRRMNFDDGDKQPFSSLWKDTAIRTPGQELTAIGGA